MHGSPPQTWGLLQRRVEDRLRDRLTPTNVGTKSWRRPRQPRRPDHPHKRGDIKVQTRAGSYHYGSPPQTWGHLLRACRRRREPGLTPTNVGTSLNPCTAPCRSGAHPHKRGDFQVQITWDYSMHGLPPQPWGHRLILAWRPPPFGLTPTNVGTSHACLQRAPVVTAHPHKRGDIMPTCVCIISWYGSPPQTWGHQRRLCSDLLLPRLTPTNVGTSYATAASR